MTDSHEMGLAPVAAGAAVAGTLGVSAAAGTRHVPDRRTDPDTYAWYRGLDKPGFTPPDTAFGVVWPLLQLGLAWGGYRLFRRRPGKARNRAAGLWLFNVGMIGGWSALFFGGRKLGPAALAAGGMLATGAAFTLEAAKVDRKAAATGVPFVAWLSFATLLAAEVWRRNRR